MKGKKTDLSSASCAISRTLQVVGDRWSLLIVRDAFLGKTRFSEFEANIGLAKNILSGRLKKLVEERILAIEADEMSPSRSRYVLTERGESLGVVLTALWQWGEDHCFAAKELTVTVCNSADDQPLDKLQLRSASGKPVDLKGLRMSLKEKSVRAAVKRSLAI